MQVRNECTESDTEVTGSNLTGQQATAGVQARRDAKCGGLKCCEWTSLMACAWSRECREQGLSVGNRRGSDWDGRRG